MHARGGSAGERESPISAVPAPLREISSLIGNAEFGTRFLPVDRYVHQEQFAEWQEVAEAMGFLGIAAEPLVRSSCRAGFLLHKVAKKARNFPEGEIRNRCSLFRLYAVSHGSNVTSFVSNAYPLHPIMHPWPGG